MSSASNLLNAKSKHIIKNMYKLIQFIFGPIVQGRKKSEALPKLDHYNHILRSTFLTENTCIYNQNDEKGNISNEHCCPVRTHFLDEISSVAIRH